MRVLICFQLLPMPTSNDFQQEIFRIGKASGYSALQDLIE